MHYVSDHLLLRHSFYTTFKGCAGFLHQLCITSCTVAVPAASFWPAIEYSLLLLQGLDQQCFPLQPSPQHHHSQSSIRPGFNLPPLHSQNGVCSGSFQCNTSCVTRLFTLSISNPSREQPSPSLSGTVVCVPHELRHQCVCQCVGGSVLPAGPVRGLCAHPAAAAAA